MEGHGCVANDVDPDSLGWSDVPGRADDGSADHSNRGALRAIQEKQKTAAGEKSPGRSLSEPDRMELLLHLIGALAFPQLAPERKTSKQQGTT